MGRGREDSKSRTYQDWGNLAMQTNNSEFKENIMTTLDYIRDLFIRSEDSLALRELDPVLQKMEIMAQKIPSLSQRMFQQGLLQALKCLETKNYVRLMDILIFEIKPLFNLNGDD